jgi:hypothetical protein
LRVLRGRFRDPRLHALELARLDERADLRFWQQWIANPQRPYLRHAPVKESGHEGRVDVDALCRDAHLSRKVVTALTIGSMSASRLALRSTIAGATPP